MIMAGRGRRLGDIGDPLRKVGTSITLTSETPVDELTLIKNINEIDVESVNLPLMQTIENIFRKLCTSKEILKSTLSSLYSKALCDLNFGEKLIVAVQQIINVEVEKSTVRGEFLTLMENEFKSKETNSQLNKARFFNSIIFLGTSFHKINIQGSRLWVFGFALLEYLEFLLKTGTEEELIVMIKQLILNYQYLKKETKLSEKCAIFEHKVRDQLLSKNINDIAKYWSLLTVELMVNDFKLLTGASRNFYVKNLKEGYIGIELYMKSSSKSLPSSTDSSQGAKGFDKTKKNFEKSNNKKNDETQLSDNFICMNLKSNNNSLKEKETKLSDKNRTKRSESQKFQGNRKAFSMSGHDDRFEKDENYYGAQPPRTPKAELHKKDIYETTAAHKNFDKSDIKEGSDI